MSRPRLLDLFCGGGGAAMGYHRAGFEVVGVDINPQPRFPFAFVQGDALDFVRNEASGFVGIHASPPCQKYSAMTRGRWQSRDHPDLVGPTRELLIATGLPYIIENVVGAPLLNAMMLCGTMFGLRTADGAQLRRHRLFECPWWFDLVPQCQHNNGSPIGVYGGGQHPDRRRPATIGVWGNAGGFSKRDGVQHYGEDARREAMGIDWMRGKELSEAIPPVYTEFLGRAMFAYIGRLESERITHMEQ